MATKAGIILDKRHFSKRHNGYPIKVMVYNNGQRYISLGRYASVEQYENPRTELGRYLAKRRLQLIQEVEYCNDNNLDLDQAVNVIKNGIGAGQDVEIALLEQKIARLRQSKGVGLLEFLQVRIGEKKALGQSVAAYVECYREFSNYLISGDLNLNQIDYDFLNGFIHYKRRSGTGEAGIMYYLRTLRAAYKEAQRRPSLGIKPDNPFTGVIRTKKRVKEPFIPTPSEIRQILSFTAKESTTARSLSVMRRNIALWEFQILIGGHDLADVALFNHASIRGGRLRFRRFKNRNRDAGGSLVDNLLVDRAKEIIRAYGSEHGRLFGFIPDPENEPNKYANWRNNYHRSIKRASGMEIRTKTPRFTFRTYAGELGVDHLIVMQIQGHAPAGVTFDYQRRLPNKIQDAEHKRVLAEIFS